MYPRTAIMSERSATDPVVVAITDQPMSARLAGVAALRMKPKEILSTRESEGIRGVRSGESVNMES